MNAEYAGPACKKHGKWTHMQTSMALESVARKHRQNLHLGITLVCAEINTRKCTLGVSEERASVQGDSFSGSLGSAPWLCFLALLLGSAPGSLRIRSRTRSETHKDDDPSSSVHGQPWQRIRDQQAHDYTVPTMCHSHGAAAQAEQRRVRMEAEWTPRDRNQEADDFSNLLTSNFDPGKEVQVKLEDQKWLVLPELLQSGQQFQEKELEMDQRKREEQGRKRKTRKKADKLNEVQGKVVGVSKGA